MDKKLKTHLASNGFEILEETDDCGKVEGNDLMEDKISVETSTQDGTTLSPIDSLSETPSQELE